MTSNSKIKTKNNPKKSVSKKTTKKKVKINIKNAVAALICLIVILVSIIFAARWLVITLKYKQYTEKMYTYGLADLYNNKKATATNKVTNEEMVKVVIAAITGVKDIDELYYSQEEGDLWLQYINSQDYITNITQSNMKDNAKKVQAAMLSAQALENRGIVSQDVDIKISKSKLLKFDSNEQQIIKKAVGMNIIKNKNSSVTDSYIIKGELNKLVVTIIEKYNTLYYKNYILDKDGNIQLNNGQIVTDKDKMPKNYKDYPYIIDSISKELYEYDFKIITPSNSQTPKEAYGYMGSLYGQIDESLVYYFNKILNIDYATIDYQTFVDDIQGSVLYSIGIEDVKEYVDYVKANKIKLSGTAVALLPIIYNNGEQYVVRTKISFKVINSDTKYNLLFGDEQHKVRYENEDITMYVDVPMGMTLNAWSLRVYVDCFAKHLTTNDSLVILEE